MKRRTVLMLVVILLLLGVAVSNPGTKAVAQGEGLAGRTITGTVYFISGRRPGLSLVNPEQLQKWTVSRRAWVN